MPAGANVVCDTPISHLQSATPSVVMSLNRKGITTIGELLAASFDEVAYQLDSFDDAEDLIGRLICAGVLKEVAIETGAGFNADYVFSGDGAAPYRGRNAPPFEYAVRSRAKKRASPWPT